MLTALGNIALTKRDLGKHEEAEQLGVDSLDEHTRGH